jgi:hypothetical protein
MEARVGIEPTYKGFADLSLTTWVPRLSRTVYRNRAALSARKRACVRESKTYRHLISTVIRT